MPQLDHTWFASQIFWLFVIFAIFYFVLSKLVLPKLGAAIEGREKRIEGDLARAGSLKGESDAMIATYEKALAESRAKAQAVRAETEAKLAKEAAAKSAELNAALADKIKAAETRIGQARKDALSNVESLAAEIAVEAARKIAGLTVSEADARAAARG
ncbi:MAG: F0F1 ATP synthase subunit B' [Alphaproteobacteria bacterium]|nr:F0F1 ATP synthase subunit B' [Alphaproteobacteria bacterium]